MIRKRSFAMTVAAATLVLPVTLAAQQPAVITGRVDSNTGVPLAAANVFIDGLDVATITAADGAFTLEVPAARLTAGQELELVAQLLGYTGEAHAITLSPGQSTSQDFALEPDPLRLTEIVVTGAGTERLVERLGTARASLDGATLQRANEVNVVQALAGRLPNVVTNQQSGDPTASTAIQIRGATSMGASQPLIVVDGVPVNNATRTMGSMLAGAAAPNRGVDINPDDIESVEILKGAAATSIYGASAGSAGALLITTKRGEPGRTSYRLHSTFQADRPIQLLPFQRSFGVGSGGVSSACDTVDCSIDSKFFSWGPELPAGTPTYDHAREIYETGTMWDNTLSMSGGTERTTFYLSMGGLRHSGFMTGDNDWFNRYSIRFNGSHQLVENLTLGASGAYVQTRGRAHQRGNALGGLLGALRTPPEFNNQEYVDPESGQPRSWRFPRPGDLSVLNNRGFDNPFYFINEAENSLQSGRFFGNVNASYTPFHWLALNYTLGADYTSDDRLEGLPISSAGGANGGRVESWQFYDRIIDHNLTATMNFDLTPDVQSGVTVGQNLREVYFRQINVVGRELIAPAPYKLSNTVARESPTDSEQRTRTEGYFLQAEADLYDQLFLTARIRNDGNSRFGEGNQRAWYPGGSIAWSFTNTLDLPAHVVDYGKLRLAYGETGQQPPIYSTQNIFSAGTISDFNPGSTLEPTQAGIGGLFGSGIGRNPEIKPERVSEIEGGIDLTLFGGRSDLSVTRYVQRSKDVVFTVGTPPSTGFNSTIVNAAELSNKGWEAQANVRVIQRPGFSVELGATWAQNRNLVKSLGAIEPQLQGELPMPTAENCGAEAVLPRCVINFSTSFGGQSTHAQVGYPLGAWRGADFARCGRGLNALGSHDIAAACEGAPDGALYIAEDGYPIQDPNTRVVGDPQPTWTGGLSATVNVRGLQVSAFVEHREGGDVLNMTRSSMYQYGTHGDTQLRGQQRTFGQDWLCQNNTCDLFNGPVVGPGAGQSAELSESWFTGLGGIGGPTSNRIEDGTNTRLRELSVAYSFTGSWVSAIGGMRQLDVKLAGRNLGLWTDYSGFDPETNVGGAEAANRGIDWFNNPLTRAFVMQVTLHH